MQSLAVLAVATSLALLPFSGRPGPEIGQPAPGFTLVDAKGKTHSLSDYKGKTVVIEWVNIACPIAKDVYRAGQIPRLQKKYAKKDVVWLSMIITEKQEDEEGKNRISETRAKDMARTMIETYEASPTAVLIDVGGTVSGRYATKTSVHLFVVDRQGVLVYDGGLDSRSFDLFNPAGLTAPVRPHLADALDETIVGKPVSTPKTKPYGCHSVLRGVEP